MKKTFLIIAILFLILFLAACENKSKELADVEEKNLSKKQNQEYNKVDEVKVFPEVWSKNGYDGASYEFKTNCFGEYSKLEECFLWNISKVIVKSPDNKIFTLEKDFNINSYSGEITRRWVLYGPANGGLPINGKYKFDYYKNQEIILTQYVDYQPSKINYPTNIKWQRKANDLIVNWTPPQNMQEGMWYKVIIFRKNKPIISKQFDWNNTSAILPNIPLDKNEEVEINVAVYFREGYAYPENIKLKW